MKPFIRHLFCITLLVVIPFADLSGIVHAAEKAPSLDAYRQHALTRQGDIERGKLLFNDSQKLACASCHSINGSASKAGPDLIAVGDSFGRRDIIDSVLLPSVTISPGYGTVVVTTKSGLEYQGVLKQSNDQGLQLMGGDGKLVFIAAADIEAQSGSQLSLMPEGLQAGLTQEEFTDLIEYLTTLKQPDDALASHHGMPDVIPEIATPITSTPFFSEELKLPRGKQQTGLTAMHQIPGQPDVFLVLHQKGMIWKMTKTATGDEKSVFSDLTGEVFSDRGPNGLLNMTFHPKFRENRKYYLTYQIFEGGKVCTMVVEKRFDKNFEQDSGEPGRRIIKFVSVAEDHSGGGLAFGPDGYLYVVMGDTGPHNDPNGHAQNLELLLGKMLRINVDHTEGGRNYAIPSDNPFVGVTGVRPEIWAYGFRNPWRFCFDPLNGDLWLADVGEDRVEEVDLVHRGGNYGWNVYEGFEPFSNQYRVEGREFAAPLFAYRRKYGNSITGGYVYRGDKGSSFYGVYLCGDYTSKKIYGVTQENGVLKTARQIGKVPQGLVSFSQDESSNLYAVGFEGMIYKLDFSNSNFDALRRE